MKIEQSKKEITLTLVLTEEEHNELYNELCDAVLGVPAESKSLLREIKIGLSK